MRLLVLSDLHFEFHRDGGESFVASLPQGDRVDVCVLAGDIAVGDGIPDALERFCDRYPQVLYVHGNHEFYGSSRAKVVRFTQSAVAYSSNLTWLDGSSTTIAGQHFVGAPLWFRDDPKNERFAGVMNDFVRIKDLREWVYLENARSLNVFENEVRSESVVITHHLPSPQSTPMEFKKSPINRFFVCNVEPLIQRVQPKLWIHGHTHTSFDYRIGSTRVVCNPFGYARYEENAKFETDRIIEV